MERKIYQSLVKWKENKEGTCLTIKGQRQVGKTYIVEEFARKNYANYIKIDFNQQPEFKKIFDRAIDVDSVIREISLRLTEVKIEPHSTLIFLDEIQECPKARSSLKWFSKDDRFDVITSGSMLGVTNTNVKRTGDGREPISPMGSEKVITLRSMDFEEYLWAAGFSKSILEGIKRKIASRDPLDESEMEVLSAHFRDYMIVGGMPASVDAFVREKSFARSGEKLDTILGDVVNDINRYNGPINALKTQRCFESIPEQLSFGNKKFHYSRLNDGGSRSSSEKYGENLLWIENAGYGNFCYAVESPQLPFKRIDDSFKVYLSDTGLLVRMMGRGAAVAIYDGKIEYNLGAVVENEVAECLVKCGYKPRFYRKRSGKNQMELDFVTEMLDQSVVIEVKSGKTRDASSISKVSEVFSVDRRIVLEEGNIFVDDDGMEHYPLFAAAFMNLLERDYDGPEF